ncbi:MAG: hypothetical protein H6916_01315 [Novosphingobium sp.]|uniref:hypothetical protein n=1 Tax=Novosphingobium sp. TaxID=1874826 RepID=UPI00260EA695|nr:hypothetical protein [Novosphingobium sp.]MCP5385442.1 hypothetical protein [Novosphingobium sp.]
MTDQNTPADQQDLWSFNPIKLLPSRAAATELFTTCTIGAVLTELASFAIGLWLLIRTDELDFSVFLAALAVTAITIMIIFWMRTKAGFWSVGIFFLMELLAGLYGLYDARAQYAAMSQGAGKFHLEWKIYAAPAVFDLVISAWALRAFLFVVRHGGRLSGADAPAETVFPPVAPSPSLRETQLQPDRPAVEQPLVEAAAQSRPAESPQQTARNPGETRQQMHPRNVAAISLFLVAIIAGVTKLYFMPATGAADANSGTPSAISALPAIQADLIVSEQLRREGIEVAEGDTGPNAYCLNEKLLIANNTSKPLALGAALYATEWSTLGIVQPAGTIALPLDEEGQLVVHDEETNKILFSIGVTKCGPANAEPASAEPVGRWTSSWGQGTSEYEIKNDSAGSDNFFISCPSGAGAQVYITVGGVSPAPGDKVLVTAGGDEVELYASPEGHIATESHVDHDSFIALWGLLRSRSAMRVRLLGGQSTSFSLQGAAKVLPSEPCETGYASM